MDEITNNATWWDCTETNSDNIFTVSTFQYSSWLPYKYEQYDPKWHIEQGYKYQLKHMWD